MIQLKSFMQTLGEILSFLFMFLANAISPYLFLTMWVVSILTAKFILEKQTRSTSRYVVTILMGAPLGVLAGSVAVEHGMGDHAAAAFGCCVALLAEQFLSGELPRKIIDVLINKLNK
ncbi:MAG: hypothetical protein IAE63_06760 [Alphaproteobacteria bacterium]|nr:hypothetical protein [Alphaproteobacteria bacterium]